MHVEKYVGDNSLFGGKFEGKNSLYFGFFVGSYVYAVKEFFHKDAFQ